MGILPLAVIFKTLPFMEIWRLLWEGEESEFGADYKLNLRFLFQRSPVRSHVCFLNLSRQMPAQYPEMCHDCLLTISYLADHTPASSAEIKNEWRYTSTLPIRLHGTVLT